MQLRDKFLKKMQHTKIIKFLVLLVSSTFFCAPTLRGAPLVPKKAQVSNQESVSLKDTFERAYMQNSNLDSARAGLRVTDETVSQANADWRPSLSVQGQQQYTQNYAIGRESRAAGLASHNVNTNYTATLAQNIYAGGATVANIGKTESEVLGGKANLFGVEQQTLFDAVSAHEGVRATNDIVNYQKQSVDFNQKFLERAEARYEVGAVSRTEVETVKANLEGAKADVSQAVGNYESAKAKYAQVVGSPAEKLLPASIIFPLPKSLEEVLDIAKAYNPSIIAAKYALEAAQYNVDLQIAGLLPNLGIQGQVGNTRGGGSHGFNQPQHPKTTKLSAAAILNIPLYSQGIPNSKVRQAYQTVAQQKVDLVTAQRQVVQQATSAWADFFAAQGAVKGFIAQVKAQELALEGAVEEFNVGLMSAVDVVEIQINLITAQINLVGAQQELITTAYAILQAMGRLTARDLRLNVKYYDPDKYYNEYKDAWIQFWQGEDMRYVKGEN